jgi:hypothetical protein
MADFDIIDGAPHSDVSAANDKSSVFGDSDKSDSPVVSGRDTAARAPLSAVDRSALSKEDACHLLAQVFGQGAADVAKDAVYQFLRPFSPDNNDTGGFDDVMDDVMDVDNALEDDLGIPPASPTSSSSLPDLPDITDLIFEDMSGLAINIEGSDTARTPPLPYRDQMPYRSVPRRWAYMQDDVPYLRSSEAERLSRSYSFFPPRGATEITLPPSIVDDPDTHDAISSQSQDNTSSETPPKAGPPYPHELASSASLVTETLASQANLPNARELTASQVPDVSGKTLPGTGVHGHHANIGGSIQHVLDDLQKVALSNTRVTDYELAVAPELPEDHIFGDDDLSWGQGQWHGSASRATTTTTSNGQHGHISQMGRTKHDDGLEMHVYPLGRYTVKGPLKDNEVNVRCSTLAKLDAALQ